MLYPVKLRFTDSLPGRIVNLERGDPFRFENEIAKLKFFDVFATNYTNPKVRCSWLVVRG